MHELTGSLKYADHEYTFTWYPEADTSKLTPITQAYGFCYNENDQLLVIHSRAMDRWQVPGGTIEAGETPIETLKREIIEEADTEIDGIVYLGAQKVTREDGEIVYQLRYGARIKRVSPSTIDPDKGYIIPRKFIDPLTYNQEAHWGPIGEELVRSSMEKLGILR